MNEAEIKIAIEANPTPEMCFEELADFEAHCDLVCGKFPPFCNTCEVSQMIAVLKARKRELSMNKEAL